MKKLKQLNGSNRIFTYKVAYDGGSAPNPFHGSCTLAICKPVIRRVAKIGDIVVGLGCEPESDRIIYCMVVDAVIPWNNYINVCNKRDEWESKTYDLHKKIPKGSNDSGDCIWKNSEHYVEALESWSGHGGVEDFERDVSNGQNVLVSKHFWYFGRGDQHKFRLTDNLYKIIPGRGHRSNSNNTYQKSFVDFFNEQLGARKINGYGVYGTPAIIPSDSSSETCSRCRAKERKYDTFEEEG